MVINAKIFLQPFQRLFDQALLFAESKAHECIRRAALEKGPKAGSARPRLRGSSRSQKAKSLSLVSLAMPAVRKSMSPRHGCTSKPSFVSLPPRIIPVLLQRWVSWMEKSIS
jgi:hypothetical protein